MKKSENIHLPDLSLEKITRIVLIIGILSVSGAIIYTLTLPEEEDILFFLLNEEQMLRDYPTNSSIGNPVTIHLYVQNMMKDAKEFQINIFRGKNSTFIDPDISVFSNPNATHLLNQNISLKHAEEWISDPITVIFPELGENQLIICELWIKNGNSWEYLPGYVLTLRIDVLPA